MEINLVNEIKFALKQNDLYFINRTHKTMLSLMMIIEE